ncbi:Serine/arginine-rich splicing factor 12 [Trichinella pseudospiralis]|uniref:Serine/arginine-rich splicing factor 12 n=1 Tax=Trichinella pseudospiralis TaxID=6337 RepID=A0A0V1FKI9_TRIPS|nr:Serine/arginine-rich splicing factor 12 [Trichinella pseudospiralis]
MSRYGQPNVSLYIRNVPYEARDDELRAMFSKYGPVRDVYIPLDYYTRRPRGFAYIEYPFNYYTVLQKNRTYAICELKDAEDALYALDRVRYHGSDLEVEFAKGDRKTPREMRSKYAGPGRVDYYRRRSVSPHRRRRERRYRSRSRSGGDRRRHHRRRSRSPRKRSRRHRSGSSQSDKRSMSKSSRSRSRTRSRSRSTGVRAENGRKEDLLSLPEEAYDKHHELALQQYVTSVL